MLMPESNSLKDIYAVQLHRKFTLICVYPKIQPKYQKVTSIEWYKGTFESRQQLDSRKFLSDSGVLEFDEVNYWDAFNYTCVSTIGKLKIFKTINIYTVEKPVLIEMPNDQMVTSQNDSINFECKFQFSSQNRPLATIIWYFKLRNNEWKSIFNENFNASTTNNYYLSRLVLTSVNELHFGYYKCEIKIENFDLIDSKPAYLYSICKYKQNKS